jgi:aspartate aminotransferase-like enzyme
MARKKSSPVTVASDMLYAAEATAAELRARGEMDAALAWDERSKRLRAVLARLGAGA